MSESTGNEAGEGGEEATDAPAEPEPETRRGVLVTRSRGQVVLHPSREQLVDLVRDLRDDEAFRVCTDVTAVDYLAYAAPRELPAGIEAQRYEVVVGLLSHEGRERLRLRVQVPGDDPTCPSLFDVHPGVEALECDVRRLVQESFAPVYPDRGDEWIDESVPLEPESYNRTILDAEASARRFGDAGRIGVIARFAAFYGLTNVTIALANRVEPHDAWLQWTAGWPYGGAVFALIVISASVLFLQARPSTFGAARRLETGPDPRAEAAGRVMAAKLNCLWSM